MSDARVSKLAKTIVNYSLGVKKGEKVLFEVKGDGTDSILKELIRETVAVGGVPFWNRNDDAVLASLLKTMNESQVMAWTQMHKQVMESVDCYVAIRGADNVYEFSSVPNAQMKLYSQHYMQEVHMKLRVPKKRWVVLRYPNESMAQLAEMGTEDFEKFYFDTCTLDYSRLSEAMDPLVALMKRTDKVRLVNSGTDLSFSIKGIPVIKCDGKINIPDGEVFTAPVRDSLNGYVTYNTPSIHDGKLFNGIRFDIKNGRIEKGTCAGNQEALESVLNTDEGSRYFGEFAIGVNPSVNFAMKDTLFDEKIYGSFHLTPGNSYDEAPNGNKSSVHWDLVQIQTPAHGGGEIWFDGKLIRKDGEFLLPELKALNR